MNQVRFSKKGSRVWPLSRWVWIPLLLGFTILSRLPLTGVASLAPPTRQALILSEFMAADESTLADADGQHTGWIEIHNPGPEDVDLAGWYLTDDAQDLRRWRFPSGPTAQTALPAQGYLIVFASGKDRGAADSGAAASGATDSGAVSSGTELHTIFRLANDGEYLALVRPDGETISWAYKPLYPPQYEDVSYGVVSGQERYLTAPTPGAANGSRPANVGPILSQAQHRPALLHAEKSLRVTVTAQSVAAPIETVTLYTRVMYGPTLSVPMTGNGQGRFSATIPAALYEPGEMVRYYLTAQDSEGHLSRWPLYHNPTNSAQYLGTMVVDPSIDTQLPVLYWFVQDPYAATTDAGTRAAFDYAPGGQTGGQQAAGILYDNVFVRRRGVTSKSLYKKSFKVDLNQDNFFYWAPGQPPVEEFNLMSTYEDKAYVRQPLAWATYRDAGVPYCASFPIRVQQNGAFYSVAIWVEQPGPRYLERQGLDPDGALYKVSRNSFDSSTAGLRKVTRLDEDHTDLQAVIDGVHLEGTARTRYLFDHLNLPSLINNLAATTIIGDKSWGYKNVYIYQDTRGTGEWTILPWDKDLGFGRQSLPQQGGALNDEIWADHDPESHPLHCYTDCDLIDALLDTPQIREMYVRRLRTLMDEFLQPPGTPREKQYYERQISALYTQMWPDVIRDARHWPLNWGEPQTFEQALNAIRYEYLDVRRVHLYETHGPSAAVGDADGKMVSSLIPDAQSARPQVTFGPLEADPASGDQDQEYLTLVNSGEVAVDLSGWRISGDVEHTFQPGVVIPAGGTLYLSPDVVAFRRRAASPTGGEGRFVQGDYRGRLSNRWGLLALRDTNGRTVARTFFVA